MAGGLLILTRDESVPLSNKTDQEIATAINRALLHLKPPAHIRIMNATMNGNGTITAITHPNSTAEMVMQDRDTMIRVVKMVDKGVIDIDENGNWEWLKIHALALIRYMGKAIEGLQMM
jgi:hypothetical protein